MYRFRMMQRARILSSSFPTRPAARWGALRTWPTPEAVLASAVTLLFLTSKIQGICTIKDYRNLFSSLPDFLIRNPNFPDSINSGLRVSSNGGPVEVELCPIFTKKAQARCPSTPVVPKRRHIKSRETMQYQQCHFSNLPVMRSPLTWI